MLRPTFTFGPLVVSALCGAVVGLGGPRAASAEQFVLIDHVCEFTKATADRTGSHCFVRGADIKTRPTNWMAPVDFRNGKVHIRTEVLEKPSDEEVNQWSYCYMPNRGTGAAYGCTGSGTYTKKGIVEREEAMTSWWQNRLIDWTQGIKEMHLVIKGSDGASGHLHKHATPARVFPTTVRITMVQVSAGSTYDPSMVAPPTNAAGPSDAGASAPADAGAVDPPAGSGGVPGAGAGGSGGSSPPASGGIPSSAGGTSGSSSGEGNGSGSGSTGSGGSSSSTPGSGQSSGAGGSKGSGTPAGTETSGPIVGGCTAAPGTPTPATGWVALLALAGLAVSQRRRRR